MVATRLMEGHRSPTPAAVSRIPADEIEALVVKCVRGHLNESTDIENTILIHNHVVRVEVQSDQLVIELANAKRAGPKRKRSRNVIEVPWHKTPSTRRREVLVPKAGPSQDARPIRSENRAILVASIARGRRWLDELIADLCVPKIRSCNIGDEVPITPR